MSQYFPDRWVVVKYTKDDKTYYKILGGWKGGYLDADSWRLNSGISKVVKHKRDFKFYGFSDSLYICDENSYGTTSLSAVIAAQLLDKGAHILSKEAAMTLDWGKELKNE